MNWRIIAVFFMCVVSANHQCHAQQFVWNLGFNAFQSHADGGYWPENWYDGVGGIEEEFEWSGSSGERTWWGQALGEIDLGTQGQALCQLLSISTITVYTENAGTAGGVTNDYEVVYQLDQTVGSGGTANVLVNIALDWGYNAYTDGAIIFHPDFIVSLGSSGWIHVYVDPSTYEVVADHWIDGETIGDSDRSTTTIFDMSGTFGYVIDVEMQDGDYVSVTGADTHWFGGGAAVGQGSGSSETSCNISFLAY